MGMAGGSVLVFLSSYIRFSVASLTNTAVKARSRCRVLIVLLIYTYDWAIRLPTMHGGSHQRNGAGAIASPPLTLQRRGPAFSITSLCRPAWRAVEVVSQRSVCCAHWKEADYFPAMVHWLCRLDKNEDTSYWANELDRYIKAKILFLSSNVSPPPEVGPSIWGLQNHLKPKYARAGFRLDEHFNLLAEE